MSDKEKIYRCEACGKEIPKEEIHANYGFCNECDEEGWWMDPAGGVHSPYESDPAEMYE